MPQRKSYIRISIILTACLLTVETIENFFSLAEYFPRSKFFSLIFDWATLQSIVPSAVFLVLFVCAAYFFVVHYFSRILFLFIQHSKWQKLQDYKFRGWFVFFHYFFFCNLVYSINAYLLRYSSVKHFFLYSSVFPYQPFLWFIYVLVGYFVCFIVITATRSGWRQLVVIASLPLCVSLVFVSDAFIRKIQVKTFSQDQNIIMLGVDSLQYNRISRQWGYPKDLAPNIAGLLRKCAWFDNAWSAFARTYPAYNSLLTGRYPLHTGVRDNLVPDKYIHPTNRYLGDVLRPQGYFSTHYTDETRFSVIRGIHGFDRLFRPEFGAVNYILGTFFDYAITNLFLFTHTGNYILQPLAYNRAHVAYNPEVFARRVIHEINKLPRQKKQFIVIHLCANHYPYFYPYPYNLDPSFANKSERCIAMADNQVGLFLDYFKKSGLLSRSLLVLYSDHGDGWDPPRNMLTHGSDFDFLWGNKMVLGFYGQGIKPARLESLVRGIDIYPTLLELNRISVPDSIDGLSLEGLIKGAPQEKPRTIFAETGYSLKEKYINGEIDPRALQSEVGRFVFDAQTGIFFESDKDYATVIKKKWYLMLEGKKVFIYNPFLKEKKFGLVNPFNPQELRFVTEAHGEYDPGMVRQLKEFFGLQ